MSRFKGSWRDCTMLPACLKPLLGLILPDAGPGCEKNGRRATWPVTTRSGRHQVPVAVLPTAKSLSAFSLKPQSDRLLGPSNIEGKRVICLGANVRKLSLQIGAEVVSAALVIGAAEAIR